MFVSFLVVFMFLIFEIFQTEFIEFLFVYSIELWYECGCGLDGLVLVWFDSTSTWKLGVWVKLRVKAKAASASTEKAVLISSIECCALSKLSSVQQRCVAFSLTFKNSTQNSSALFTTPKYNSPLKCQNQNRILNLSHNFAKLNLIKPLHHIYN